MITYHDVIQGSVKWLLLRQGLWTGSKILRLLQGKSMPADYEWSGDNSTRRGHALEVAAIREYDREYKTKTLRPGFITNSEFTNAGYSPDGIDGEYLLEIKAFNGENHEDLAAGNIPVQILAQIHFGMVITGLRKARLIAFNPEYPDQMKVIEIYFDQVITDNIEEKLVADMSAR